MGRRAFASLLAGIVTAPLMRRSRRRAKRRSRGVISGYPSGTRSNLVPDLLRRGRRVVGFTPHHAAPRPFRCAPGSHHAEPSSHRPCTSSQRAAPRSHSL